MRVAVFLGSSPGPPAHRDCVTALADGLVARGIGIVYGGAQVGLMGLLAERALAAGGEVIGVIPRDLFAREVPHRQVTRLIEVDSMHERKARMAELADAFVALPGGVGTLEELFEVFTWGLLGIHDKPVALLDPGRLLRPAGRAARPDRRAGLPQRRQARRAPRVRTVDELLATYDS